MENNYRVNVLLNEKGKKLLGSDTWKKEIYCEPGDIEKTIYDNIPRELVSEYIVNPLLTPDKLKPGTKVKLRDDETGDYSYGEVTKVREVEVFVYSFEFDTEVIININSARGRYDKKSYHLDWINNEVEEKDCQTREKLFKEEAVKNLAKKVLDLSYPPMTMIIELRKQLRP